jgi:hypothetical protein
MFSVGSLAGCAGFARHDENDATCLDEYRLLDDELENNGIETDPPVGAVVTVEPLPVTAGEQFEVTLTNESDGDLVTTGADRYAIQHEMDDGWFTIVGVPPELEWDEQETILGPGEGFSWQLTATRQEMVEEPYVLCTLPTPETYRFIYWGLPDAETLPAAEFRIEENE